MDWFKDLPSGPPPPLVPDPTPPGSEQIADESEHEAEQIHIADKAESDRMYSEHKNRMAEFEQQRNEHKIWMAEFEQRNKDEAEQIRIAHEAAEQRRIAREAEQRQAEQKRIADKAESDRMHIEHLKFMAAHEAKMAHIKAQAEEFDKHSLTRAASNVVPRHATRSTQAPFDVIVYIDHHGGCDAVGSKYLEEPVNNIHLSLMRSGRYGSISVGKVDTGLISTAIQDIMAKNRTKEAVFHGLQQMFRYRKQNRPLQKRDRQAADRDTVYDQDPGFEYTLDVKKFYNTFYTSDESYNSVTVVYTADNRMKLGDKIPGYEGDTNALANIIGFLQYEKGYKNIGVIEHACNDVSYPDGRRTYTSRTLNQARKRLKEGNVTGGRTKRRKLSVRKSKSRRKLLRKTHLTRGNPKGNILLR